MRKLKVCLVMIFISSFSTFAQFSDCTKGLLLMPSAEMEKNGTFMISNNFINKHYTTDKGGFGWAYHTFSYGFDITFWSRLEVAYVCTLFNGDWNPLAKTARQKIVKNQDRHFAARFQLVKENEFDLKWIPSIVLGLSDPVTGSGGGEYIGSNVSGSGNGFFNRYYLAASKHFETEIGELGAHVAFQYTKRKDFAATGPCFAVTWNPIWLNQPDGFVSSVRVIAEYDAKYVNVGISSSVYNDHWEGWICMQACQWLSAGLRYKFVIK